MRGHGSRTVAAWPSSHCQRRCWSCSLHSTFYNDRAKPDGAGTFATYHNILTQPGLLVPIIYTFGVALTVTLFALVLSYPVAFVISSLRGRLFTLSMALILIPFWNSTVIRTYAWIVLLQRRGVLNELLLASGIITHPLRLTGSDFGMQIAMVHIMLPFMMLPLLNTMRGIDRTYLRAASVLGANPFWQFTRVFLPLSLPGVSAGCTLCSSPLSAFTSPRRCSAVPTR